MILFMFAFTKSAQITQIKMLLYTISQNNWSEAKIGKSKEQLIVWISCLMVSLNQSVLINDVNHISS